MFYLQLRNELWKLFGKKRTYIGFAMFLLTQNIVSLVFRFTRASTPIERLLEGNGYLANPFISVRLSQPSCFSLAGFLASTPLWWAVT
jgi:ABC-2 type transport system permease protein